MSSDSKEKNYWRLGLALAILLLFLLIVAIYLFVVSGLFAPRQEVSEDIIRPLVLFQTPANNETIETGSITIIQVTASSYQGISRIELWANDTLIAASDSPDPATINLTLTQPWTPYMPGNHVLVARALSPDGSHGQATLRVVAFDGEELDNNRHTVREGEDLDDIADLYGLDIDDLVDLNPDIIPEDLGPGDGLILPEDDEPPTDPVAPEIPDGGEAPPPEDDPPADDGSLGRVDDLLETFRDRFFDLAPLDEIFPGLAGDYAGLQIELLGLLTQSDFERLYCYLGAARNPAERYPRGSTDDDTDASFSIINRTFIGDIIWGLDSTLAEVNKITVFWQRNRPVPINLACVGITDGGTTAIDLGRFEDVIQPSDWGRIIEIYPNSEDEYLMISLRINRVGLRDYAIPGEPDLTMTPPVNARLDLESAALQWDYSPNPGEEIDGFRIYLNNNLQWVESARVRESRIPIEWINPPCHSIYHFSVTAFRHGLPTGPESLPAETQLSGPEGNCQREIEITFLSLETFYLGEDGRRPPHHGDIGPVYGHFFANDHMVGFDTRDMGGGGGRIDIPQGLRHHRFYDLGEMAADPAWGFSRMPTLIVETPMDGSFQFGFHIMDQDQGRCRRPSDPGCDDLICDFQSDIITGMRLDQHHEGTMLSDNGRCQVAYRWGPAFGTPVGTGVEGWESLPSLYVEEIFIDDSTGTVSIELRNIGSAAWPRRDLTVELQTRWGYSLGVYTWPDFDLGPGLRTILTHPDMILNRRPFDACVLIDPYDDVLEHHENTGAWLHQPYCPPMPDLSITNLDMQFTHGGRLHVSVNNAGPGHIQSRDIYIHILDPEENLVSEAIFTDISIAPRETTVLVLEDLNEIMFPLTASGYRVVVNPWPETIAETTFDNNHFDVPPSERLFLHFYQIRTPYLLQDAVSYQINVNVLSGTYVRPEASWHINRRINWDRCHGRGGSEYCDADFEFSEYHTNWFEIMGSELLEVSIIVTHHRRPQYNVTLTEVFSADTLWGSGPNSAPGRCQGHPPPLSVRGLQLGEYSWPWNFPDVFGNWQVWFVICRDDG